MGTLETEVAQHITVLIDGHIRRHGDDLMAFTAHANGDLIHITTADNSRLDAWVLTVEWDGER